MASYAERKAKKKEYQETFWKKSRLGEETEDEYLQTGIEQQ